jgi:hypothetical protein
MWALVMPSSRISCWHWAACAAMVGGPFSGLLPAKPAR